MSDVAVQFSKTRLALIALLTLLVALAIYFYFSGYGAVVEQLVFDYLRDNREVLQATIADNFIIAISLYMLIYAAATAFSVPGGAVFTVCGGFLFGSLLGTTLTVFAATVGATAVFLIARSALGEMLRHKAKGQTEKLLEGLERDAFNYLLVLRLVPLFPFFIVNIAPAFASVPLRTYVIATFVGIIPGSFVFSQVGAGLGSIFDAGETLSLSSVLTLDIFLALTGLAVLSLIPVVYKRIKARKTA